MTKKWKICQQIVCCIYYVPDRLCRLPWQHLDQLLFPQSAELKVILSYKVSSRCVSIVYLQVVFLYRYFKETTELHNVTNMAFSTVHKWRKLNNDESPVMNHQSFIFSYASSSTLYPRQ